MKVKPPDGYHWMDYEGGPVLMPGDYAPHDGAVEEFDFEIVEEHDPDRVRKGEEWDKIYNAILERTGNKELAAATATARAGSRFEKNDDDPKTPAKPSERRSGSTQNPEGSAGGQRGGIKLSEANIKALEAKRDEHNEKIGDAKSKRANLGALKAVFRRGAGAFSTSHRPSVRSRDQWAMARVNAFLHLLDKGKPKNANYVNDNDLLPEGHPRKSEAKKRLLFVVTTPSDLDVVRKQHLCGTDGALFLKHYLRPLGLCREDVDVMDLGEISQGDHIDPAGVIALGKASRAALEIEGGESAADVMLPHPYGVRKSGGSREMLARKLSQVDAILRKQKSYQPPLGVQDAAARGLMLRAKHGRGGTEVGVARARDLKNGRRVSIDTVKRMVNFFTRHARDLEAPANKNPQDPGWPGAGLIAHLLWGGSPGRRWAEKILRQYEREQAKKSVTVYKTDDAKRIIYGVVLDPYIVDAHDDNISPKVIEETAHDWLSNSRQINIEHDKKSSAQVVESWIHPYPTAEDYRAAVAGEPHKARRTHFGDDVVHSGSWILGVKLSPENWEKVKENELNGFSIGGFGTREEMSEADMPEVEYIDE